MCEKYAIEKLCKVYQATNRHTGRQYRRFTGQPRRWFEGQEPVRHADLVETLENAVNDWLVEQQRGRKPQRRPSFRAPVVPPLREPLVRPRGEGDRV